VTVSESVDIDGRPGTQALASLRGVLADLGSVIVGFSGGADSALLAYVAHDVLGPDRATAVTAVSPSLPADERDHCARLAAAWDLSWVEVETHEMLEAAYRRNDLDRCGHCKDALMDAVAPLAGPGTTVTLGVNLDDLGDHRPGQRAAAARGAQFPLVRAGFTKEMVRSTSRDLGLSTWDRPAAACLASRLPYGTPVTIERLGRVEAAEAALRTLGFDSLRVRDYGDTARIEVPLDRLGDVVARRSEVVEAVRAPGFGYVTLDLEGLRSGNLNP
jgi:uncharacterized protein